MKFHKTTLILALFCLTSCQTAPKSQNEALVELGNEYAADNLLREASDVYKKALQNNPRNRLARRNLGIVQIKAGSYEQAVSNLERVIGAFEKSFDSNFYLAEGYRALGKYAEAIYRYKKALQLKPEHSRTMKALAWSYFKIRYYSQALEIAKKLRKLSPNDGQVAIILARTLEKLRKSDIALKLLRKAKAKAQPSAIAYFESVEGDLLQAMNRCNEAIKTYRSALKVQPLLAGSLLGLGRCYLGMGKVSNAISYMERAVRIRPNLTEAYYLLGKAYEKTNRQKSITYYKKFRHQAGKDPEFLARMSEVRNRISALSKRSSKSVR